MKNAKEVKELSVKRRRGIHRFPWRRNKRLAEGKQKLAECKHKVFSLTDGPKYAKYLYGGIIKDKQTYSLVNIKKYVIFLYILMCVVLGSMTEGCQGCCYENPFKYNRLYRAGKLLNNTGNSFKEALERFWLVFCTFEFIIFIILRKAMCFCLHVGTKHLQQLVTAGNSAHFQETGIV